MDVRLLHTGELQTIKCRLMEPNWPETTPWYVQARREGLAEVVAEIERREAEALARQARGRASEAEAAMSPLED